MHSSTTSLLTTSAVIELAAGMALSLAPRLTTALLLGEEVSSPEAVVVARIAGAALIAIGLNCWFERDRRGYGARAGLVTGLLVYNASVAVLLGWSGVVGRMRGFALWPAVVLHATLFAWCVACLRFAWPTRTRMPTSRPTGTSMRPMQRTASRLERIDVRVLLLLLVALATTGPATHAAPRNALPAGFAAGESGGVTGFIVSRRADDMIVRDQTTGRQRTVTLTADTRITAPTGLLNIDVKRHDVTALIPGLIVAVRGSGGSRGNLLADKISFRQRAFRVATPTAERTVDRNAISARMSELDDYEVKYSTTLSFAAGSAELAVESKRSLDTVIQTATRVRGYLVEVVGFADATESPLRAQRLGAARADVVVAYLTQTHSMPLRRIVKPSGLGTSPDKRALNRRVEVTLLQHSATGTDRP